MDNEEKYSRPIPYAELDADGRKLADVWARINDLDQHQSYLFIFDRDGAVVDAVFPS